MTSSSTEPLLAGRYRVVKRLGAGGMATVFLAEDERLGRPVAVKRLHADSPEDMARRFEREARLGASLNHPNIVSVYDIHVDPEVVLIVMEYVEGETLGHALRGGALGPRRALQVIRCVAAALDHAHANGVVHRDVKPANVLLGARDTVKLADLGIARAAEGATHVTRTGTVLGTPSYMAPEQLEGGEIGAWTDTYALACVAFEALAGRKARAGRTPLEIAHRVASEPPPDLGEAWPDAPPAAADLLRRAMARDPAERPHSAREFAEHLTEALLGADDTLAQEHVGGSGSGGAAPAAAAGAGAGALAGAAAAAADPAPTPQAPEAESPAPDADRADAEEPFAGPAPVEPEAEVSPATEAPEPDQAAAVAEARGPGPSIEPAPEEAAALEERVEPDPPAEAAPAPAAAAPAPAAAEPAPAVAAPAPAAAEPEPAAAAPAPAAGPSAVAPAPPTGGPPASYAPARPARRRGLLAAAALLLALVVAGAFFALQGDDSGEQAQRRPAEQPRENTDGNAAAEEKAADLSDPAETVKAFYERSAAGEYREGWKLVGPGGRSQLQGFSSYQGTFDEVESVRFPSARTTSRSGDQAEVALRSVATKETEIDRCNSTFTLSRAGEGWQIEKFGVSCQTSKRS